MNITKLMFLSAALMVTMTIGAQKKRNTRAVPELNAVELNHAISDYRFADAEAMLNPYIDALRARNLDPGKYEDCLRQVQQAKKRLNVTEKVTIIDSMVVRRDEILMHLPLSSEIGALDTYAHMFNVPDTSSAYAFRSQLGDHTIFAKMDADSTLRLYESKLIDTDWTNPTLLDEKGLAEHDDLNQNYPFVLNDGVTLYYAAEGDESMGGYDIFMTRFDMDDQSFLAPENIGMPFNSPANDYLYIVDEYYQLGWFVSDRNQDSTHVCIYTFVPNSSRNIYDVAEIGEAKLRALARLSSIAETWADASVVEAAKLRLAELKSESSLNVTSQASNIRIVLNDNRVITSLDQFKSKEARQQAQWWIEGSQDLDRITEQLSQLRLQYTKASAAQRSSLTTQILELEQRHRSLTRSLKEQLLKIRSLEK